MKASKYLLEKLKESRLFEDSKNIAVTSAIVENQKISSICENNNENEIWLNNKKTNYARQMEK